MNEFMRQDWTVEVQEKTWKEIVQFLTGNGWTPGVPVSQLLAASCEVSDVVAKSLAQAGNIILEGTIKDPISAYATISFDMGKFAEIVEFSSEGAFVIRQKKHECLGFVEEG